MERTFFSISDKVIGLIEMTILVIVSLAVFGFMWGIVKFIFNAGNEKARSEGRAFMLYGILTLFVMTSMWGLVNILSSSLSIEPEYTGDVKTGDEDPEADPFDSRGDLFENNNPQRRI